MNHSSDSVSRWRHTVSLLLWLYLLTPVGLWKLWNDDRLSTTAKWRLLLYAFVVPVLVYATWTLRHINHELQHLLP